MEYKNKGKVERLFFNIMTFDLKERIMKYNLDIQVQLKSHNSSFHTDIKFVKLKGCLVAHSVRPGAMQDACR